MYKKIILLLLVCCIAFAGFAQKNKRKTIAKAPKNTYFEMLINGSNQVKETYCPDSTIVFDFRVLDPNIKDFTYCWYDSYYHSNICNSTPIELVFPKIVPTTLRVELRFEIKTDDLPILDTLVTEIKVDFIRTILDTMVCKGGDITLPTLNGDTTLLNVQSDTYTAWDKFVSVSGCDSLVCWHIKAIIFFDTLYYEDHGYRVCQGRDITVTTLLGNSLPYENVQEDIITPFDTLTSVMGCDSLVCFYIKMDPYLEENYQISSCDSVIWGFFTDKDRIILKRPEKYVGDWDTTVYRIFPSGSDICDTKIFLTVIIIAPKIDSLKINFDQDAFCSGDDMEGTIELETNFTAFNWKYRDIDTTILKIKKLDIEYPGIYTVFAYMDTSLYDTLPGLRIVNCYSWRDTLVKDCDLIIPNVITPNGDGKNDIWGFKKLIPERENELTIYDRWGKSVFHQKNYKCVFKKEAFENTEDAFKGLSRGGQKLPEGTYYYAFKYKQFPKPKTYKGILMILR